MNGRSVRTETSFYTDPDLRGWAVFTKYFYRYLYENEHCHGITGIGRFAEDVMRAETELTRRQVEQAWVQMGDRVQRFPDGSYWVVGRAKHTCYRSDGEPSPKHAAAASNYILGVSRELRRAFGQRYPDLIGYGRGIDTPSIEHPAQPTVSVSVSVSDPDSGTEAVEELSLAEARLIDEYGKARINGPALRIVREMLGIGQGPRALAILRYGQAQHRAGKARDMPAFVSKILLGDRSINDDGAIDAAKLEWRGWERPKGGIA